MAKSTARRPARRLLFTIPAVAEITDHSPRTVEKWIGDGRLPSVKPGRNRLVTRAALAAFLGIDPSELDAVA